MTLSEIRRAIDALKRKFATELTIIKARRIAEAVSNDWDPDSTTRTVRRHPALRQSRLPPHHLRQPRPLPQQHPTPGRRPRTLRHGRQSASLD